jgi:hypothetical protein
VSVIFNAMLILEMSDRGGVEALNKLLYEKDTERHQQFGKVDMDGAGGTKFFTTDVYAAAFNHFVPEDVEECIAQTPWRFPDTVLYVRDLMDYHYDEARSLSARTVTELRAGASRRTQETPEEDR